MKKKLLSILLCATMIFSMAACGNGKTDDTEGGTEVNVTPPTLTKLAAFDDVNAVLTGDYEINDEAMADGFLGFANSLGLYGEWVQVTDRDIIEKGDIVKLDYTGYLDGEAFSGGAAKDQYIDVTKNASVDGTTGTAGTSFITGFTDGLLGAKVGETIKHDVTFPENYGSETLNGKLTTFEFKIHGIYTFKAHALDSINDEFVAANFKDYELTTVEELKNYVKETITYGSLLSYIVDKSEYDISDEYVEYRTDKFVEYQEASLMSMYGESMTIDTYLSYVYGCTLSDILPSWQASIKNQIKYELVYEGIVKENGLELDEKALEEYILSNLGENATEEDLEEYYKYVGAGSAESGKNYLLNETEVRELLEGKLGFTEAE